MREWIENKPGKDFKYTTGDAHVLNDCVYRNSVITICFSPSDKTICLDGALVLANWHRLSLSMGGLPIRPAVS